MLVNSEEAQVVQRKYNDLIGMLDAYQKDLFGFWSNNIVDESEANLHKPLLTRDEKGLLKVNCDPKVVALLREVKYFGALQVQVPQKAMDVYSKQDELQNHISNLEFIVGQYNAVRTTMISVEAPLLETRVKKIDEQFETVIDAMGPTALS